MFFSDLRFCVAVSLSKLKNLRSLDVSNTEFSTNNLIAVVEDLPYLESLDISNTKVDTLLPLGKKKNQLRKLSVYNLKVTHKLLIFINNLLIYFLLMNNLFSYDTFSIRFTFFYKLYY